MHQLPTNTMETTATSEKRKIIEMPERDLRSLPVGHSADRLSRLLWLVAADHDGRAQPSRNITQDNQVHLSINRLRKSHIHERRIEVSAIHSAGAHLCSSHTCCDRYDQCNKWPHESVMNTDGI